MIVNMYDDFASGHSLNKELIFNNGFTIIELIVAIVIMTLILSVGIANFRGYSQKQAIVAVYRQLKGDLRNTQAEALAGKKPTGCNGVLAGYTFSLTSSQSYQITPSCSGGFTGTAKTVSIVAKYPDVTITLSPAGPIIFQNLGKGTKSAADYVFTITQAGTSVTLTVTPGGEVN